MEYQLTSTIQNLDVPRHKQIFTPKTRCCYRYRYIVYGINTNKGKQYSTIQHQMQREILHDNFLGSLNHIANAFPINPSVTFWCNHLKLLWSSEPISYNIHHYGHYMINTMCCYHHDHRRLSFLPEFTIKALTI